MPLSLERLRVLTRRGLGNITEEDLYGDDASIDELLNMSLWELESKFPFKEKECKTTIQTVVGQERYQLPSYFDSMLSVALIDDYSDTNVRRYRKLFRGTPSGYHTERDIDDVPNVTLQGTPERYYRRSNFIILDPIPDEIYDIEMVHMKTISDILEGGKETTGLPQNWDEITLYGAITKGHFLNQDYSMARQAKNFQLGYIYSAVATKVKDEADSRYAQFTPLTEEFPS